MHKSRYSEGPIVGILKGHRAGCRDRVPPQCIAALRLQRLLYDQTRRKFHQLTRPVRTRQSSFNQLRKGFGVRIDPGTFFAMGCLLVAPASTGAGWCILNQDASPPFLQQV